ncbi:hypothetical protein DL95DRAFT_477362 [Leptodontidium sp. 2 PMI_412]|nr:hypothetical protein DL95DRAFT_477362 [Leptodontidium sp. 2 PMI_412]
MRFSTLIFCITAVGTAPIANSAPFSLSRSANGITLSRFDTGAILAAIIRPRTSEDSDSLKRELDNNGEYNNCYDAYGNRVACGANINNNNNLCTDSYGNRYICGGNNDAYCYNRFGNQCECNDPDYDEQRTKNAKEDAKKRKQQQKEKDQAEREVQRVKEQKEREKQREEEQTQREKEQKESEK